MQENHHFFHSFGILLSVGHHYDARPVAQDNNIPSFMLVVTDDFGGLCVPLNALAVL